MAHLDPTPIWRAIALSVAYNYYRHETLIPTKSRFLRTLSVLDLMRLWDIKP